MCTQPGYAAVPESDFNRTIRIGSDLQVVEAVMGYVDATGRIIPSRRIDTAQHQGFAWRVKLSGRRRTVRYREEFVLPAPAQTWQVGAQTTVSPDRSSATTEGDWQLDATMELRNGWIHTQGDPKGAHVFKIWIDGVMVEEFDFILY